MNEIPENNGFKTPENYFETFSSRLLTQVALEDKVSKDSGFKTPDGYFDGLNAKILQKVKKKEPKVISLLSFKKYYYAASAVAAVFLFFIVLKFNVQTDTISFQDIADVDIESYFNEHDLGLSTYDLAEIVPVDQLEIQDIVETSILEEQIVNYLDANEMDIEGLYLEDYE